jgi:hypothetical protein
MSARTSAPMESLLGCPPAARSEPVGSFISFMGDWPPDVGGSEVEVDTTDRRVVLVDTAAAWRRKSCCSPNVLNCGLRVFTACARPASARSAFSPPRQPLC